MGSSRDFRFRFLTKRKSQAGLRLSPNTALFFDFQQNFEFLPFRPNCSEE